MKPDRRQFIKTAAAGGMILTVSPNAFFQNKKEISVEVVNPGNRVPVSLIIDDSTTLVNMAYYGIPQFAEVFPDNYKQDWRKLPHEIPDRFVREFGEWCLENDVKGKYSIVPYPACTGWINRFIPGWTEKELKQSLDLVREVIVPNWDIHPEMISHTRVIDIKTGKPFPHASPAYMENWEWSQKKSVDELAAYQAYALQILKDVGLPCEGITTPGGYGSKNQDNLAVSTLQALRDVYKTEIPHYFRDLFTEKGVSVAPQVRFPADLESNDSKCVVSILGCTGDWFGGWDGLEHGNTDLFISPDLKTGRLVDVIESGEPAIMVCHWPGIYFNGEKTGFTILKEIKYRLDLKYDHLRWMKLSEIARYWAAKELTKISVTSQSIFLKAPFAANDFTLKINSVVEKAPLINTIPLLKVRKKTDLKTNTFFSENDETFLCFNLSKGESSIYLA